MAVSAAPAQGTSEPLTVFVPVPPVNPQAPVVPPPTGYFNGPCGLAVDSTGRLFVSDYYHHAVDVFSSPSTAGYVTQIAAEDPLDGPCGLALDPANRLYVNNFHRDVVSFNAAPAFGAGIALPLPAEDPIHHLPTGVAVDPSTGNVYVDDRTYVAVYDSSGNPVMDGAEPLRVGKGNLGDGYGVAISAFPGKGTLPSTVGRLYVPDASTNTVKVYDPALSKVTPVAEIKDPFNHPFSSLRDSAVAVDQVKGDVYFSDNTQPAHTEKPQAMIYVYNAIGVFQGHLKYNVADALPVGLAVDNSSQPTQGEVYVTSGNTNKAGIYVYPSGAATTASPLPPTVSLVVSAAGGGSGAIVSRAAGIDCSTACATEALADEEIALAAAPDPGSEFTGWSGGGCAGKDICRVEMDEAASVTARFAETPSGAASRSLAVSPPISPVPAGSSRRVRRHRHHQRHRHRAGLGHGQH
jgi:hypothetical protein